MKSSDSFAFLATTVTCCFLSPFLHAQALTGSERVEMLRAAEWYQRNRDSFRNLKCRYVLKDYGCKTIRDAIQGENLGKDNMTAYGLWVVRGSAERHTLGCDPAFIENVIATFPKQKAQKIEPGLMMAVGPAFPHANYLSNGRYTLTVDSSFGTAGFHETSKGRQPHNGLGQTMALGFSYPPYDPGSMLRDVISGKLYGRFECTQVIEGHKALVFAVGKSEKQILERFWLDPGRGFLPIRFEDHDSSTGVLQTVGYITDARQCSGNRWFPTRSFFVNLPRDESLKNSKDNWRLDVRVTTVPFLDANAIPTDEDFVTVIKAGCQLQDNRSGVCNTERADRTITLDGLNDLAKKLDKLANRPNLGVR